MPSKYVFMYPGNPANICAATIRIIYMYYARKQGETIRRLMGDHCMKSLLVLRRAPQRSDVAYESGDKDVWFDHGDLISDGDRS